MLAGGLLIGVIPFAGAIEEAPLGAAKVHVPEVIRVGAQTSLTRIADAARIARDGDTVEIEAGDYIGDVASWPQNNLTVRAIAGRVRIVANGSSAEDKAIWVVKGTGFLVEGIEFTGARVVDNNGAGIRHEGGKLTVRNCLFDGNQMGLLTWNDEHSELVVEGSEFRGNTVAPTYRPGDPVGHQIYVGSIGRFSLRDSYIHQGAFGHLVKSRARENYIINNRITDERNGKASYELEFPNGGLAYVVGNLIEQSPQTENRTMLSFGAEGYRWAQNELYIVHNTLVDDLAHGGKFLHVTPGPVQVEMVNNLFFGRGRLGDAVAWKTSGNVLAKPGDLPRAMVYDYRLSRKSKLLGSALDPGTARGFSLLPRREYMHPMGSRLVPQGRLSPGALQIALP
jgi:hypothetical protein